MTSHTGGTEHPLPAGSRAVFARWQRIALAARSMSSWSSLEKIGRAVLATGSFLAVISTASGIIYGVFAFEREREGRERERISAAWKTISDYQAANTNLGLNEALEQLNSRAIDLSLIHLPGAYLSGARLPRAKMDGAILNAARLDEGVLCDARLSQVDLHDATLNGADLSGAQLNGANLSGAKLRGTNFGPSHAKSNQEAIPASLHGANLERADLSGANLVHADLRAARLAGAILLRANLQGAILELADLTRANLGAADLTDAKLGGAIMSSANLRGTKFVGASLEAAQLDGASIVRADFSGSRGMPSGIDLTGACMGTPSVATWCGPPQRAISAADVRPQMQGARTQRGSSLRQVCSALYASPREHRGSRRRNGSII
jgi:uncharacterized protein YjbI with pentapeptide repeats